jgi:uncharacterized protein (TIGR02147 family)
MNQNVPSIYAYNDFKIFLAEYQKALEKQDNRFSKSAICRQLGIPNSRSYFNDVVNQENPRKVTPEYIERFIRVFKFEKDVAQFFRALVKYNQAENSDEKELYLEQLISLNKTPKTIIDKKAFVFFKEWHHSVIRTLLDVINFKDDHSSLARLLYPAVSQQKVKESIELLKSLQLIKKNDKGYWKPSDKSISTSDYLRDDLIVNYQMQCLDLAKQALLKKPVDLPRKISTNLLSVSKEGLDLIQKKVEKFRSEIRSLVHKDNKPAEFVYQMNIQLFPSAKVKRGNDAS